MVEFPSHIDVGMSRDIKAFMDGSKEILSYKITADADSKILINIKLKECTIPLAKNIFLKFVNFVGYGYFNLYIKEELGEQIKYLYITANQEWYGTKMEVFIS